MDDQLNNTAPMAPGCAVVGEAEQAAEHARSTATQMIETVKVLQDAR